MDQPKIERMLRLMRLMTGNTSLTIGDLSERLNATPRTIYRYIDTIRDAGYVVNKLYGNVYQMGRMQKGLPDFSRFIYFSEEEAHVLNKLIDGLDNTNAMKIGLKRKLECALSGTNLSNFVGNKMTSHNIEVLSVAIKSKSQVVLAGYESGHSDDMRDRLVEPFAFTTNMVDVWAYDIEIGENKIFKISRIREVLLQDENWQFESDHKVAHVDVFRMSGAGEMHVRLQLDTLAKSLLLEEYPIAERDLHKEEDYWILDTVVSRIEGVGRFVLGLAPNVKIMEGPELEEYIRSVAEKYIKY